MYATISIAFAISTLYIGNTIAAPAGLPPNVRDIVPSSTTSFVATPTITPKPVRRNLEGVLDPLDDLVFPQMISPSVTSSSSSSSTFEFRIHTKPTAKPASHESRNLAKKAQSQEDPFGGLGELSFPQKISASASTTSAAPTASASNAIGNQGSISFDSRDLAKKAQDPDHAFGVLDDLRFPQAISSSASSTAPTTTPTIEHNIPKNEQAPQHTRRPDLSTFFSNLELVNTSNTQNTNATPMPADMRALYITLSDAFRSMRQDGGGNLLDTLIESLEADAEAPPREVKGVSDAFLDDRYPLVVRLPCHRDHVFDLECIAPWLKLHATCPLDRKNLLKKKEPSPPPKDEEEDGEYDEMFA
ncbi:MAG: hypothetical protein Q9218_005468 [Villophora microphyllina]